MPDKAKNKDYLTAAGPPGVVLCAVTFVMAALGVLGVWPFFDRAEPRPFGSNMVLSEISPPNSPRSIYAFPAGSSFEKDGVPSGAAELALGRKMNLCRARVSDLMLLPGIGPKRARTLADYIRRAGLIKSIDDLADAPGIGPETIAGLKPWAQVRECKKPIEP